MSFCILLANYKYIPLGYVDIERCKVCKCFANTSRLVVDKKTKRSVIRLIRIICYVK